MHRRHGQHHTRATVSASRYCAKCKRMTQHRIDDRRFGSCLDCMARLEQEAQARAAAPKQEEMFSGRN
jgi:hypothetical protein